MNDSSPVAAHADLVYEHAARQLYPPATLYIVATPIGNLADITLRALHVFSLVDAIACEDTRNTSQMLQRYGLRKPLIASHLHNEREAAQKIVARLQNNERIALVSDAGTPGVSDPGARVVEAVLAAGLRVMPLPGASAAIAALSAAGLLAEQFHFVGFLPNKAAQRHTALKALAGGSAALVFYEAPHRIVDTLAALEAVFGADRHIVVARELTKLYETIHRGPLSEAMAWMAADTQQQRGEFVLVLAPGEPEIAGDSVTLDIAELLAGLLEEMSVNQAVRLAVRLTGRKKNQLYEQALMLKNGAENGAETS